MKTEKVKFELLDGSVNFIDPDKAEEFIVNNLGNFKKKHFKPRGKRRAIDERNN